MANNDINDFYGFTDSEPEYPPMNNKGSTGGQRSRNGTAGKPGTVGKPLQYSPSYNGGYHTGSLLESPKFWKSYCIVFFIVLILAGIMTATGSIFTLFEPAGIEGPLDNVYRDYTKEELGNITFNVYNKSYMKDVSKDTVWYLNGVEIAKGQNWVSINSDDLLDTENRLEAKNKKDVAVYILIPYFDISTGGICEATMLQYDANSFMTYNSDLSTDKSDISSYYMKFGWTKQLDNRYDTVVECAKAVLEYSSSDGAALGITDTEDIPKIGLGNIGLVVSGDFSTVTKAYMGVIADSYMPENFTLYKYNNNTLVKVDAERYNFNGRVYFNISAPGVYAVYYSDFGETVTAGDYYNLIVCDISKGTRVSTGDNGEIPLSQIEESLVPNDYEAFVEKVASSVGDRDSRIIFNSLVIGSTQADLNLGGSGEVYYSIGEDSIEKIISNLTSMPQYNTKQEVYVVSSSTDSSLELRKIVYMLRDKAASNPDVEYRLFSINSSIKGIDSFAEYGSNLVIEEYDTLMELYNNPNELTKYQGNSKVETIYDNGSTKDIKILASSGFEIGYHNPSSKCFGTGYGLKNTSYGICLLSKIAMNKQFTYKLYTGNKYDRPGFTLLPGMSESFKELVPFLTREEIDDINTLGLHDLDIDFSTVIQYLTVAQCENLNSNFTNILNINTDHSKPSYIVDELSKRMKEHGPLMLTLEDYTGYTTVLLTRIGKSVTDINTYYLYLYDPMAPEEERIVKLVMAHGYDRVSQRLGYAGYLYGMSSEDTVTNLYSIDKIEVYGESLEYSEYMK